MKLTAFTLHNVIKNLFLFDHNTKRILKTSPTKKKEVHHANRDVHQQIGFTQECNFCRKYKIEHKGRSISQHKYHLLMLKELSNLQLKKGTQTNSLKYRILILFLKNSSIILHHVINNFPNVYKFQFIS